MKEEKRRQRKDKSKFTYKGEKKGDEEEWEGMEGSARRKKATKTRWRKQ